MKTKDRLKQLKLLIIDEVSMVGLTRFAQMMERLEDCGLDFDRIGIVLIGDPAQCPPVSDVPFWSTRTVSKTTKKRLSRALEGRLWFLEHFCFSNDDLKVFYLKRNFRREDLPTGDASWRKDMSVTAETAAGRYFDIMGKVRDLNWTDYPEACRDWEWLRSQCCGKIRSIPEDFKYATLAFATNDEIDEYNMSKLLQAASNEQGGLARIPAVHHPEARERHMKKAPAKEFGRAPAQFYTCAEARVMVQWNLWVEAGVVNSALGTHKGLVYEAKPPCVLEVTEDQFAQFEFEDGRSKRDYTFTHQGERICLAAGTQILTENGTDYNSDDNRPLGDNFAGVRNLRLQPFVGPPQMPTCGIVELDDYDGPPVLTGTDTTKKKWVPIEPQEFQHNTNPGWLRKQLPLRLAWSTTPWKLQGASNAAYITV